MDLDLAGKHALVCGGTSSAMLGAPLTEREPTVPGTAAGATKITATP